MSTRPLQGLGVVITRPREAAEAQAALLRSAGAHPILFPALAIEAITEGPELLAALDQLVRCDLAIFVSANAVEHGVSAARRYGGWPASTRVAAIGQATAQALRNSGFSSVISPRERHDSEALLAQDELQALQGRSVLIFRGRGGREALRESLESRGAKVTYVECYRRYRPPGDPAPLLRAWGRHEVHAVSALSGETIDNFVAMVGPAGEPHIASTPLVVPHEAIAAHPSARRFARVGVADAGDVGMLNALAALRVTS